MPGGITNSGKREGRQEKLPDAARTPSRVHVIHKFNVRINPRTHACALALACVLADITRAYRKDNNSRGYKSASLHEERENVCGACTRSSTHTAWSERKGRGNNYMPNAGRVQDLTSFLQRWPSRNVHVTSAADPAGGDSADTADVHVDDYTRARSSKFSSCFASLFASFSLPSPPLPPPAPHDVTTDARCLARAVLLLAELRPTDRSIKVRN